MTAQPKWTGEPRTEAERKFFTLRESGYTGPIDQNGNKVTSGRAKEILDHLRDNT